MRGSDVLHASNQQKNEIAKMFQQLLKQDPMIKKVGGYTSAVLLESVRFQFQHLPFKPKKIVKKIEVAGRDEPDEQEFYVFRFKWNHPCIDYSVEIVKEIPVKDFEAIV
jgi:hypothetical protein